MNQVGFGASSRRQGVVGINLERAVEQIPGLVEGLALVFRGESSAAQDQVPAANGQIDGVRIIGIRPLFSLRPDQFRAKSASQSGDHLVLHFEEVGNVFVE